jgi:hypothetical protein
LKEAKLAPWVTLSEGCFQGAGPPAKEGLISAKRIAAVKLKRIAHSAQAAGLAAAGGISVSAGTIAHLSRIGRCRRAECGLCGTVCAVRRQGRRGLESPTSTLC